MKISQLKNKRILILGYGVEGKATKKFLKRRIPEARISTADAAQGQRYLEKQAAYDLAIRSPGLRPDLVTIPYTTAANLFFANAPGMIIGVTGSKGKSTTSALIYAMLKTAGRDVRLVGNIGYPMLEELLKPANKKTIYVCELSSFQTMDLHHSPHISVILNFYEEHLDFHGTREMYWQAKEHMLAHTTSQDYFVYNPAYARLTKLARTTKAKAMPVIKKIPFALGPIALKGTHNESNIRAALTVARILRVSDTNAKHAIQTFQPLPHRLQPVGTYRDIEFYDDSIATIPEAAMHAVDSLGPRVETLILGGFDRGINFSKLGRFIAHHKHIRSLIFFPTSGKRIARAVRNARGTAQQYLAKSMEKAVAIALRTTSPGHICLLSPASPSFGLFKNYQDRGEQFRQCVKKLAPKTP